MAPQPLTSYNEIPAMARVVGKDYKEAGQTYVTQKVGNKTLTIPQSYPEMYVRWAQPVSLLY